MPRDLKHLASGYELTREHLAQGTLLHALRADPPAGLKLRSDAELERTLQVVLDAHESARDLHVFGYGSLMWNPALEVVETSVARVHGWHRGFCLRMIFGRGTPEEPGAMLGLDRGGACNGLLYRIDAAKVEAELRLLWRREMLAGAYDARWVPATVDDRHIRALTFVVNRAHDRYIGGCPIHHVAHLIRTGRGPLGTSRAYFDETTLTLERLGLRDTGIERLRRAIGDADVAEAAG
ncbi:gamma-glutamylcyclotransferase [Paraburkholderia sp. HP33-1]|uniref:gamma-glutamylcyclotransferase n=1 Tax=Paraburkholderia sp. HP33-1 TaxID=2883243 RepID=UPI001F4461B2|nr:gamma-glutamylcyclotransferase [Paraburkholderia sp. HP33-1]